MKDEFKLIYCILKILQEYNETGEWKPALMTPEAFRVSKHYFNSMIQLMQEEGLIRGAEFEAYIGSTEDELDIGTPFHITMSGLQYLQENSAVKKAGEELKKWVVDVGTDVAKAVISNSLQSIILK